MYFDSQPCRVCGSEVRMEPHSPSTRASDPEPDSTIDERVCTNTHCETNQGARSDPPQP